MAQRITKRDSNFYELLQTIVGKFAILRIPNLLLEGFVLFFYYQHTASSVLVLLRDCRAIS